MSATIMRQIAVKARPGPRDAAPAAVPDGGGLAAALFVYLLVVTAVVTLAPFEFARPDRLRVHPSEWTVLDVVANVLLFVPLGFVGAMARPRVLARGAWRALALGAAVSIAIEGAQLFAPERYSSPWDVLTNAAGAWLGARALGAVRDRLDPATLVGRLALELPLMGLVYLLVPLGWLSALTIGAGGTRPLLLLCLGLFGASVLGAVQRRHFGPAGIFSPSGMAAAAAGWFLVTAIPALNSAPGEVALVATLVAAFTWHRASGPGDVGERRFERRTLIRAAPFLAAYLLLLPLTEAAADHLTRHVILRIVETMTAFAVLGYAVAEAMGRRELPLREAAPRVAVVALPVAIVIAVLRAVGMPAAAEIPRLAAAVAASLYGAWLYDAQRRNVRGLLRGEGE
ncbi:MAG TPA: VanZ family protein [Gemmatimonadales bacterium]